MDTLTDSILAGLSPTSSDVLALVEYAERFQDQPIGDFLLIVRTNGFFFYPFDDYDEPTPIPEEYREGFTQALAGEIHTEIRPPGGAPEGYAPAENSHTLIVYAPLYRIEETQPIGVVETIRAVPELTNAILAARVTGLLVATITMGVLFLALLFVIRRADNILTTRSRELENAYTDLQRAEVLRDDMTHMIVHDLRNPISAISASLDIIEQSDKSNISETGKRFTGIAKNASKKMIGLVDDILTVSKFEAGELSLNVVDLPVSQVITKSIEGFRSQSEAEQKQLGYHSPDGLMAKIDPTLIVRVLDNLIANAIKYTEEQTGIIEVFVQAKNNRVYFHVRDNGEGIPDEFKLHIFDKFKQVPGNGSERKGTGLGLTFCRMVVETHGGQIKVQDVEGGGSEFVFWVPESKSTRSAD
jgi:signal transduction histidine kinase